MSRPRLLVALLALAAATAAAAPAAAQDVRPRVVGGTDVAAGDYPWQVALLSTGGVQYCGGTLVDDDWVLTARHCEVRTDEQVRVGSTNRSSGGQVIGVAEVRDHPLSSPGSTSAVPRYDVTMVRLDAPETDPVAEPLAPVVPGTEDDFWAPGEDLTVTGWGATFTNDPDGSTTLQEAVVPRVGDGACGAAWGSEFSSADMVCAGIGTTDTCQGDSGGPMVVPVVDAPEKSDPTHWRQVGITSWGGACADPDFPGVYARLGATLVNDWTSLTPPVAATPTLSGGSRAGESVTCSRGAWTGRAYFTYRFFREGRATSIAANTTGAYTLAAEDVGARVFCRVRGENAAATVDSPDSGLIGPVGGRPIPVNTTAPALSGEPVVGRQLRCEPGSWQDAASITYGFRRIAPDGSARSVASGATLYAPTADDVGSQIVCVETATNSFGTAEAASAAAGPVTAPPPPDLPDPPVVPTPRDQGVPETTRVTRRCQRRRCTLGLFTRDTTTSGAPLAGVARVEVRLTSRYRCVKGGRRRSCIRRRTLTAAPTLVPGLFRVWTPRLPRGLHTVRVTAVDASGNREPRALTYSFRLRR